MKKDRSTASNRITALHAHKWGVQSGTRISWCDLLRTNVILPHKILCSEILHIIPNRNNLSTATLQQEVYVPVWRWVQCTSSSSASPVSDHEQTELSLPQSLLLFIYRREPRGNSAECPVSEANGHYVMFFLEIVSAEQLELLKHRGEYVGSFTHSLLPPAPHRWRCSQYTKPDAQGSLTNGPLVRKASIHRKTWLVASSPYSLPRVNSI